jgi:hypothetical protein
MRHKNQQVLDALKPTRRPATKLPALVLEGITNRNASPEAKAAASEYIAKARKPGKW